MLCLVTADLGVGDNDVSAGDVVEATAAVGGRVVRDEGIRDVQGSVAPDSTAVEGAVIGDGCINERQNGAGNADTAAIAGAVEAAGDRQILEGHVATDADGEDRGPIDVVAVEGGDATRRGTDGERFADGEVAGAGARVGDDDRVTTGCSVDCSLKFLPGGHTVNVDIGGEGVPGGKHEQCEHGHEGGDECERLAFAYLRHGSISVLIGTSPATARRGSSPGVIVGPPKRISYVFRDFLRNGHRHSPRLAVAQAR